MISQQLSGIICVINATSCRGFGGERARMRGRCGALSSGAECTWRAFFAMSDASSAKTRLAPALHPPGPQSQVTPAHAKHPGWCVECDFRVRAGWCVECEFRVRAHRAAKMESTPVPHPTSITTASLNSAGLFIIASLRARWAGGRRGRLVLLVSLFGGTGLTRLSF